MSITQEYPVLNDNPFLLEKPYWIGPSDFDAQMCSIKFWKGEDNPRPVFENIECGCFHFWLSVHKKYILTLLFFFE